MDIYLRWFLLPPNSYRGNAGLHTGACCISSGFASQLRNPQLRKPQFFIREFQENLLKLYIEGRHYFYTLDGR